MGFVIGGEELAGAVQYITRVEYVFADTVCNGTANEIDLMLGSKIAEYIADAAAIRVGILFYRLWIEAYVPEFRQYYDIRTVFHGLCEHASERVEIGGKITQLYMHL